MESPKCKSVSIAELREGNTRLCLSTLRVFNKCYLCACYDKCESRRINPKNDKLIKELEATKQKLKDSKEEYTLKIVRIENELRLGD